MRFATISRHYRIGATAVSRGRSRGMQEGGGLRILAGEGSDQPREEEAPKSTSMRVLRREILAVALHLAVRASWATGPRCSRSARGKLDTSRRKTTSSSLPAGSTSTSGRRRLRQLPEAGSPAGPGGRGQHAEFHRATPRGRRQLGVGLVEEAAHSCLASPRRGAAPGTSPPASVSASSSRRRPSAVLYHRRLDVLQHVGAGQGKMWTRARNCCPIAVCMAGVQFHHHFRSDAGQEAFTASARVLHPAGSTSRPARGSDSDDSCGASSKPMQLRQGRTLQKLISRNSVGKVGRRKLKDRGRRLLANTRL